MNQALGKQRGWLTAGGTFALVRVCGAGAAFVGQALLARWYPNDTYGVYAFCWSMLLLAAPVAERGCKSATPVPATPPSGVKYQPVPTGADYDTGDAESGWRCLKFSMNTPQYFQYGYTVGGPYLGPKHGGPDPGPNGFEAWAVGDLDGDGVTSLFTATGKVVGGKVVRDPKLFIHNEHE